MRFGFAARGSSDISTIGDGTEVEVGQEFGQWAKLSRNTLLHMFDR